MAHSWRAPAYIAALKDLRVRRRTYRGTPLAGIERVVPIFGRQVPKSLGEIPKSLRVVPKSFREVPKPVREVHSL